jgi:hypothetical protein
MGECSQSIRIQSNPQHASCSITVGPPIVFQMPICWRPALSAALRVFVGFFIFRS